MTTDCRTLATTLLFAAGLGACGGDDAETSTNADDTTGGPTTTSTSATTAPTTTTDPTATTTSPTTETSETDPTGVDSTGDSTTGEALAPFSLRFAAVANGEEVGCGSTITGLGPDGEHTASPADLRFYISNLRMYAADGSEVTVELDVNDFQYTSDAGQVSLIDLTSNTEGDCESSAIAFAEGTARENDVITGMTQVADVTRISFDVGVPQAVMKDLINTTSAEAAPSPLGEMYWSWATGYRHFVFNFSVEDPEAVAGGGYLHIGSTDCAGDGELALENQDECGFLNTPKVDLDGFDLAAGVVAVDLGRALEGVDFLAPIYDPKTFEIIGEGPGVECHSSPMQPHCATIFASFGVDIDDGTSAADQDAVFGAQ